MKTLDLNVDIGEGFPFDDDLLQLATSANVCLGVHSGSPELTRQTFEACRAAGVRIGVHPGYPDRDSLGRRPATRDEIRRWSPLMVDSLRAWVDEFQPAYLKPHGAFYNTLAESEEADDVLIALMAVCPEPRLMGLDSTRHRLLAVGHGWGFLREGFADRGYRADGTLIPRNEPGAILKDPDRIKHQILDLAPKVDSLCLHGDTPGCLGYAEFVIRVLRDAGYQVGPSR